MSAHEPHVAFVAMLRTTQHENLRQKLLAGGVTSEHLSFREAQRSDLLRFDGALVVITVGGHTAINAVRQRCEDTGRPCFLVDHKASSWPMDRIKALPLIRTSNAADDPPTPPLSAEEAEVVLSKGDISSFGACLRAARKSNDLNLSTLAELIGLSSNKATSLLNEWETDRSSPTREQHALLLELFPALGFAPLPTWPVEENPAVKARWLADVEAARTALVTTAKSWDTPPAEPLPAPPEVPMPPPQQLDKNAVIKLASLTATARSALPEGVRDLLLTAKQLNFTLQDVLDLLAIQEHS